MTSWSKWTENLGGPKFVLAPMVDHSELPWRMLSREYGCQLAYTPMFHALNFASQKKYRERNFSTCEEDKPLIVQFCANQPEALVAAAKHVESSCNGIDLNLGCPQDIARRGNYGAFLQDDWGLISEMVTRLRSNLGDQLTVSCKIRRFEELAKTEDYARLLERAGCDFIGVHGRTRAQRGCQSGLADWSHIAAAKSCVSIPVIANGNVQSLRDAETCLLETGADAVMSAEGNLYNPALFQELQPPAWLVADKYLDYVERYPIASGMAKSHLFKLFHRCLAIEDNASLRASLSSASSLDQLRQVVVAFRTKYQHQDTDQTLSIRLQPVPPYLCQPRFRYAIVEEASFVQANHTNASKRIKSS